MQVIIRAALLTDAGAIAALMPGLGYAASTADMERRLARVMTDSDHAVLVAEVGGELRGLCQIRVVPLLASDGYAEIYALVISDSVQRQGVGTKLIQLAKKWAAAKGHERLRLYSGQHRKQAHAFYEALGFDKSKLIYAFDQRQVVKARPILSAAELAELEADLAEAERGELLDDEKLLNDLREFE